jgi:hypothetical protein
MDSSSTISSKMVGKQQISFPLTIGGSLLCFMVLRTVFKLQPGEKGVDPSLKSDFVIMDFSQDIKTFWTPAGRENSWFYTYNFSISPDDGRIFFSDSASNTTHGEIYSSHIAVFEIEFQHVLRVNLAAAGPVDDLELLQKVKFHPSYNFVLLTYPSCVNIWNYNTSKCKG